MSRMITIRLTELEHAAIARAAAAAGLSLNAHILGCLGHPPAKTSHRPRGRRPKIVPAPTESTDDPHALDRQP